MIGDLDTISDDLSHLPPPIPFRKRGEQPRAFKPPVIDRLHGTDRMSRWTEVRFLVFAFILFGFADSGPFDDGIARIVYDTVAIVAGFYLLGKITAAVYKRAVCFDCVEG